MPYNSELLNVIDYRIKSRSEAVTAIGTVSSRSTSIYDNRLMVLFDGSSVAMPVKAFGGVWARPGDRVRLVKFGSEWVVVGSFSGWRPSEVTYNAPGVSGTTTSGTYSQTPGGESVAFTKAWDETNITVCVAVSVQTTAVNTTARFGVNVNNTSGGTGALVNVTQDPMTPTATQFCCSGKLAISGLVAGPYVTTLQWLRSSGS